MTTEQNTGSNEAEVYDWEDIRPAVIQDDEEQVATWSRRALARLRRQRDLTQRDVAEHMGVSQARVSAIESREMSATELATLAKYVAALGGKLRLVVDFDDSTFAIE